MKCAVVDDVTVVLHFVPSPYASLSTTYVNVPDSLAPVYDPGNQLNPFNVPAVVVIVPVCGVTVIATGSVPFAHTSAGLDIVTTGFATT